MKLPQLTFTRFIAAAFVLIYHYGQQAYPFNLPIVTDIVQVGNIGVSYFFVLSGFILVISQIREEQLPGRVSAGVFWIHRFARVYPMYLFAFVFHLFLVVSDPTPTESLTAFKVLSCITLLQAWFPSMVMKLNSPGWSLSAEAFFYALFPIVYFVFKNIPRRGAIVVGVVLWGLLTLVCERLMHVGFNAYFIYTAPILHLGPFLLGMGTAFFFIESPELVLRWRIHLGLASFGGTALALWLIVTHHPLVPLAHNGLFAPLFALLILALSGSTGRISRLFASPWGQYLGDISYSLYIMQVPVWILVSAILRHGVTLDRGIQFYVYLPVIILVSAAGFRWVEVPWRRRIRQWGEAWLTRRNQRTA